jgi:hypothetical protein
VTLFVSASKTVLSIVIARFNRAIQYSRGGCASPRSRGVLDAPHARGMQRSETRKRILAAHGVRVFPSIHPHRKQRAQGRPGALRTHGPRAAKKHAAEPQVRAGTPGLPCAMVLRLIRDLPGESGLCCHRCLASSRKAQHLHRGARTTRLHRPHHAVRLTTQRGHRIPLPTFVTIAKRPSCGCGTRGRMVVICPTAQGESARRAICAWRRCATTPSIVIASDSEAIQDLAIGESLDCFVALLLAMTNSLVR